MSGDRPAFLDRPSARVAAALVIFLCGVLLAYVHRDDLRTLTLTDRHQEANEAADDPAGPCIEQRFAEIDGMIEDGLVDEEQAAMFRQRAEAMCRATEGGTDGPPPLPPSD